MGWSELTHHYRVRAHYVLACFQLVDTERAFLWTCFRPIVISRQVRRGALALWPT